MREVVIQVPSVDAGHYSVIIGQDLLGTVITEWFFFLLTLCVLIPTNLIIIAELTRWALNWRKGAQE